MKLATLKDGSRDGLLAVVARDLASAHFAAGIAGTMQQLLDDWNFLSPQLEDLYATLNDGKARHAFAFDARQCMAPLPRAFLWLETAADPAQGVVAPPGVATAPPLRLLAGDDPLGPVDDVVGDDGTFECSAGMAVITGDVAAGAAAASALEAVRLLLLVSGWHRHDPAAAAGPWAGRVATACAPVALTPDEVGDAWQGGRVQLALQSRRNGRRATLVDAAAAMPRHFGELIAHAAAARRLRAGTVVGTLVGSGAEGRDAPGRGAGGPGEPAAAEAQGAPRGDGLRRGDRVEVEMLGRDGLSLFGATAQRVVDAAP